MGGRVTRAACGAHSHPARRWRAHRVRVARQRSRGAAPRAPGGEGLRRGARALRGARRLADCLPRRSEPRGAHRGRVARARARRRVRVGREGSGSDRMTKAQFGIIGLGTMGRNLALNFESRGYAVAVWNLETEWIDAFLAEHKAGQFIGARTLQELAAALERPRRIVMMIPAGEPVEAMIAKLQPLLERGDILVDGGNSWFEDTRRREARL